ncbi:MAG TPA: extensin family protein, partial [Beijerinckiaceae bacterium]|nr:extensin family protein [Beijerinckiaceae bacterium]
MRAILGLAGLALVLSASVAAFAEVPLPPPRPEGIVEEAAPTGDVPLPPVRPHGIENERPPADGAAAAGAATQPEGEDSAACIERLAKAGVRAEPMSAIENGACGARHPLRLIGLPAGLEVSPPAIVTCAVAEALAKWVEGVSAEAERHLS